MHHYTFANDSSTLKNFLHQQHWGMFHNAKIRKLTGNYNRNDFENENELKMTWWNIFLMLYHWGSEMKAFHRQSVFFRCQRTIMILNETSKRTIIACSAASRNYVNNWLKPIVVSNFSVNIQKFEENLNIWPLCSFVVLQS